MHSCRIGAAEFNVSTAGFGLALGRLLLSTSLLLLFATVMFALCLSYHFIMEVCNLFLDFFGLFWEGVARVFRGSQLKEFALSFR